MLELKDITLDEQERIEKILKRREGRNSESSFAYFYIWSKGYNMKYAILDDMMCISAKHKSAPQSVSFPIGYENSDGSVKDVKHFIEEILDYFNEIGERPLFHLYNDRNVQMLEESFPGRFEIKEERNSFDYVYKSEDLINLSGKRYHSKKNHVNRFKKLYPDWEYCRLTEENSGECLELFDKWLGGKETEERGVAEERVALAELLNNCGRLNITGGGIRVGGELAAFSFGEAVSSDTAVIHFEHADPKYSGAFNMINQQFVKNEWSGYTYINREEDMGIEGMRKAKESYRPIFMAKKYSATLK